MDYDLVLNARETGKWVDRNKDEVLDKLHVVK